MKISNILVQPPFFRCVGSHNDRAPLELAYASRYLMENDIDHAIVNADYLGSCKYLPVKRIYENESMLRSAVDGDNPLIDECVELVMQYNPDTVVISAGDSCIPTKNLGSPYIAAVVSRRIRSYGVKTIGIGPIFIRGHKLFENDFDGFFLSMVNRSIVDVLSGDNPDVVSGTPLGAEPYFERLYPIRHSSDYVMSSFGCVYDCSFCMAHEVTGRQMMFQPVGIFIADLISRGRSLKTNKLYVADMIFPLNPRRLRLIADALDGQAFDLACEARTDTIKPENLEILKKIGVSTVKVGIESFDDDTLRNMSKRQNQEKETLALERLRDAGFKIVGYLIFGDFYASVDAMEKTLDRAAELDVDHWVVNMASYKDFGWDERKMDAHFSMACARRQGVPEHVVWKALELQEGHVNPTVETI